MEKKPSAAERLRNNRKRKQEDRQKYEEFSRLVVERDLELILEFKAKEAKQEVHEAVLQSEASDYIENFTLTSLLKETNTVFRLMW